jgi:hypothetical protein
LAGLQTIRDDVRFESWDCGVFCVGGSVQPNDMIARFEAVQLPRRTNFYDGSFSFTPEDFRFGSGVEASPEVTGIGFSIRYKYIV